MSTNSRLLPMSAVMDRLSLKRSAAYALIHSGKLRAYKVGGSIRVAEADLERFLAGSVLVTEPDRVVRPTAPAPDRGRGASPLAVHPLLKPRRA
jgi:excisionase family DNA binding protein